MLRLFIVRLVYTVNCNEYYNRLVFLVIFQIGSTRFYNNKIFKAQKNILRPHIERCSYICTFLLGSMPKDNFRKRQLDKLNILKVLHRISI